MIPKVSVVMPVYSGLPYLKEAIESVLSQTFTDFEFLIVDDGSTDASVACIESYNDSRIRFIRNEKNMGQARTLNRGLELARGEYIARLDQDDVCLPDRLKEQVAYMDAHPHVAITCTWEHTIDDKGRMVRSWRGELKNYGAFLGEILLGKCPVWHPSVMFRRQAVLDLGGYDPSYVPADDYELWARIAMKRLGAAFVPEFLLLQRIHGGRQSIKNLTVQVANTRRAHEQLVRAFCSDADAAPLAAFLRMDGSFWREYRSPLNFKRVLSALETMCMNVKQQMRINEDEYGTLARVISERLGFGFRAARMMKGAPSPLLYATFLSLSPLFIPPLRAVASALNSTWYQLRYPRRFIQARLARFYY